MFVVTIKQYRTLLIKLTANGRVSFNWTWQLKLHGGDTPLYLQLVPTQICRTGTFADWKL